MSITSNDVAFSGFGGTGFFSFLTAGTPNINGRLIRLLVAASAPVDITSIDGFIILDSNGFSVTSGPVAAYCPIEVWRFAIPQDINKNFPNLLPSFNRNQVYPTGVELLWNGVLQSPTVIQQQSAPAAGFPLAAANPATPAYRFEPGSLYADQGLMLAVVVGAPKCFSIAGANFGAAFDHWKSMAVLGHDYSRRIAGSQIIERSYPRFP